MVDGCPIAKWSIIWMPFEYPTKFIPVFRPSFEYQTSEYWTSKSLLFRCFRYSSVWLFRSPLYLTKQNWCKYWKRRISKCERTIIFGGSLVLTGIMKQVLLQSCPNFCITNENCKFQRPKTTTLYSFKKLILSKSFCFCHNEIESVFKKFFFLLL